MDSDQARAWFERARVARLATATADARPHLVPVTFAVLEDAVLGDIVVTAVDHKPKRTTRLKRLRNIESNPAVSLLTDHYEEDWSRLWWVRADGDAGIADAADRPDLVRALAEKYSPYQRERPSAALIVVQVRGWSGWCA